MVFNEWTNGLCSNFAIALQNKFGGEIWAIVNHSRICPNAEDDTLLHCYCVIDGIAYDAEGANPLAEVSDISGIKIPEMDK
ncbi:MAG: hypothetical protein EBV45_07215, partial [Chloroflexi bacterium]|nr:hypothetical protein [Chloroflexota bacterium]